MCVCVLGHGVKWIFHYGSCSKSVYKQATTQDLKIYSLCPLWWDKLVVWMGPRSTHDWPKLIIIIPTQLTLWLVQKWAVILGLANQDPINLELWLLENSTKSFNGSANFTNKCFGEPQALLLTPMKHKKTIHYPPTCPICPPSPLTHTHTQTRACWGGRGKDQKEQTNKTLGDFQLTSSITYL